MAACIGLAPGTFSHGLVVPGGVPGTTTQNCQGNGFRNAIGFNNNGRVDPTQGAVRTRTNGASGSYHGLQTRFDTRFSDILINANYTWSKTIDNASEIFSTFAGGQAIAVSQDPFDTNAGERGLSAFHQAHNFTTNFIYELPFYKDQKGLSGKLLGGYQISGIVRLASGRPYTPVNAFGQNDVLFEGAFLGAGTLRPYQGNPDAPNGTIAFGATAACAALFNDPLCINGIADSGDFILYNTLQPGTTGVLIHAATTQQAAAQAAQQARLIYNDSGLPGLFGGQVRYTGSNGGPLFAEAFNYFRTPYGIGRNTLFGGMFKGVNLALFKSTKINERYKVEFRVEANNVLNTRNFGVPDAVTEDAFGSVAVSSFQNPGFNAGAIRSLRFGLRFLF
jgi:hypothetical protein